MDETLNNLIGSQASAAEVREYLARQSGDRHPASLILGATMGRVSIIDALLDGGWTVEDHDQHGVTPLMAAAEVGRIEVVTHLLKRGATVTARDAHGQTALFYALRSKERLAVLKVLLEHGGRAEDRDNRGTSLWEYASDAGASRRIASFEVAFRRRRAAPPEEVAELLRAHGCKNR